MGAEFVLNLPTSFGSEQITYSLDGIPAWCGNEGDGPDGR